MVRRGLQAPDVARLAGISPGTMTAALHDRAVSAATVAKIGIALTNAAVIPNVENLIDVDGLALSIP